MAGFNPHPARKPGATRDGNISSRIDCRFQSSPGPKAGCYPVHHNSDDLRTPVSILTRPESRVLPSAVSTRRPASTRFNPHPARKPGATALHGHKGVCIEVSILTRPESRVLLGLGDTAGRARCVSILTRPESRVLLTIGTVSSEFGRFQSSPGPKAGCYNHLTLLARW